MSTHIPVGRLSRHAHRVKVGGPKVVGHRIQSEDEAVYAGVGLRVWLLERREREGILGWKEQTLSGRENTRCQAGERVISSEIVPQVSRGWVVAARRIGVQLGFYQLSLLSISHTDALILTR